MMRTLALSFLAFLLFCPAPAPAQTSRNAGGFPPPGEGRASGSSLSMPVPQAVIDQAREQEAGDYGALIRPRSPGQIQRRFDQLRAGEGVYLANFCRHCIYRVRTRERMVTVIELPEGERIDSIDLGDVEGFSVQPRGERRIAVKPIGYGYDTSMSVYGASGYVYSLYLRTEGFNSENTPDLYVRILGPVGRVKRQRLEAPPTPAALSSIPLPAAPEAGKPPARKAGDFVRNVPFKVERLYGWSDYEIRGDEALRPETIFRDDYFTYIRFGKRWKDIELPTAYVLVDGQDELVNTRVKGSVYIVESTRAVITLKSGKSFLCIRYTGEEGAEPRVAYEAGGGRS